MGKLQITKFTIEFESPDAVYYAGQSVIGAVCIELSEPTSANGE